MTELLTSITRAISMLWQNRPRYTNVLLVQGVIAFLLFTLSLSISPTPHPSLTKRTGSWGGFGQHPLDERCYKQERVAMLLSVFVGVLGGDHWYARHWLLATFKLLTLGGLGVWWVLDIVFWIVGGFYGTPGCPGGSKTQWLY